MSKTNHETNGAEQRNIPNVVLVRVANGVMVEPQGHMNQGILTREIHVFNSPKDLWDHLADVMDFPNPGHS